MFLEKNIRSGLYILIEQTMLIAVPEKSVMCKDRDARKRNEEIVEKSGNTRKTDTDNPRKIRYNTDRI